MRCISVPKKNPFVGFENSSEDCMREQAWASMDIFGHPDIVATTARKTATNWVSDCVTSLRYISLLSLCKSCSQ